MPALPQVACVTRPVPHQVKAMASIARALRRHNVKVRETYDRIPSEGIVFVWSWKWSKEILEKHPDTLVCTLDHGLLHPRNDTVVTGWMGLNGLGEHPLPFPDQGLRLKQMGWDQKLKAFRESKSRNALILGQCYNDVQILDHLQDYGQWLVDRAEDLRREGFEVYFRPHPVQRRNDLDRYPRFAPITQGKWLHEDIDQLDISCVLGFNSNALLDSWMYGVQDIRVYNRGSMLWPVCVPREGRGDQCWSPAYGSRQTLANHLAYCQWTPEEIMYDDLWVKLHLSIMRKLVDHGTKTLQPWWTVQI